jgi:hypothetical protein
MSFAIGLWSIICAAPRSIDREETVYMAQKVIREFVDDIDGSEAERTFTFAIDGTHYEIDLSTQNIKYPFTGCDVTPLRLWGARGCR